MAIIAAIIGVVGSVIGGAIKSDKARKDRLNLKTAAQAQVDADRNDRFLQILGYNYQTKDLNADILKWTLIAIAIIIIVLMWYALRKKK